MQSFTKEFMKKNSGCYSYFEYKQLYNCSFMKTNGEISLTSIINSEIPLKDKFWFVCHKILNKKQNRQVAIAVAEVVIPIFEKRYPNDVRPREAIEAAKQYIAGHISKEALRSKGNAAYAAYAYAAYANKAAANSDTSTYAVYAAAAAAYANSVYAYKAAYAYSAVYADAIYKEKLLQILLDISHESHQI